MSLVLRKALLSDSSLLLAWRNDPDVIASVTSQRAVTEAEHDRWLIKVLSDKTNHVYIAVISDDTPIGMGRINEGAPGVAVLSYSIASEHRRDGFGSELVLELCQEAHRLGYRSIQAVARHRNTASLKCLLSNGFTIDQDELLHLTKDVD
jgi:RimJ/RimL family protein N-acetyltransferase